MTLQVHGPPMDGDDQSIKPLVCHEWGLSTLQDRHGYRIGRTGCLDIWSLSAVVCDVSISVRSPSLHIRYLGIFAKDLFQRYDIDTI